jgi:hypothetical protein
MPSGIWRTDATLGTVLERVLTSYDFPLQSRAACVPMDASDCLDRFIVADKQTPFQDSVN